MPEAAILPWAWALGVGIPIVVVLILVSALVERASPIRLRHWAEKAGPHLAALYEQPRRFEAFRFLLTVTAFVAPIGLFAVIERVLDGLGGFSAPWVAGALVVLLVGILEWLARFVVAHHAEEALEKLTWLLRFVAWLIWPLVLVIATASPTLEVYGDDASENDDEVSPNELEAFIDVGRREGILEPEEEELVKSIVDFGDTVARQVMTPRVDICAAPVEASLGELADELFSCKHARLPLYHGSIDQIVGILHIRDLFEAMRAPEPPAASELTKAPFFVPETKPIRALLSELQALHQQMAIVVDEYGGVAGLVTVEDLVEEIVGEIADEHEVEEVSSEVLQDGGWRLAGRTELLELAELVGHEIENGTYETVSGMICGRLGYVPKPGERLETDGLSFRIEAADQRRVTSVLVYRLETESVEGP